MVGDGGGGLEVGMSSDRQREEGVERDEKYVSNIRSIKSVPAQIHHRVGAKENKKEREKATV